jgi:hypothetical protein
MMLDSLKCVKCQESGQSIPGDVEVPKHNILGIQPGWYCFEHLFAFIIGKSRNVQVTDPGVRNRPVSEPYVRVSRTQFVPLWPPAVDFSRPIVTPPMPCPPPNVCSDCEVTSVLEQCKGCHPNYRHFKRKETASGGTADSNKIYNTGLPPSTQRVWVDPITHQSIEKTPDTPKLSGCDHLYIDDTDERTCMAGNDAGKCGAFEECPPRNETPSIVPEPGTPEFDAELNAAEDEADGRGRDAKVEVVDGEFGDVIETIEIRCLPDCDQFTIGDACASCSRNPAFNDNYNSMKEKEQGE